MNQDVLTSNIANSASLNRYSYVEGNPISYTDPFGLSPWMQAIHAGLDILGALPIPGFEIFDGINAALYFFEGKWGEAIKSIIYMAPGMDFMGKATNYAVKGGKYAKQALAVAEYATIASRTMAVLMSAEDFGKTVAGMIDKYLVYEAEITWEIAYDFLVLAATGVQLGFYTGSALKIPDELAKYDFDEIMKQNIRARYETTAVDGYISGVTVNYSTLSNAGNGGFNSDWNAYLDDIEKQTGRKIPKHQRKALLNELNKDSHSSKLEGTDYSNHRKDFNSAKNSLIETWERKTGQKWPTYSSDVISKKGNVYIKAGSNYDAHEIIPNKHNSPLEWWNIHPAANPIEHQGGIHRAGGPFKKIFSEN